MDPAHAGERLRPPLAPERIRPARLPEIVLPTSRPRALFGPDSTPTARHMPRTFDVDLVVRLGHLINRLFQNVDGAVVALHRQAARRQVQLRPPSGTSTSRSATPATTTLTRPMAGTSARPPGLPASLRLPGAAKVKARWAALKTASKFEEIFQVRPSPRQLAGEDTGRRTATWPIFNWTT